MGWFLPLLIGGAIVGAGLGVYQATEQNKAAKKAGRANMLAAKSEAESQYKAMLDQGYRLNQTASSRVGNFLSSTGMRTGGSMNSMVRQMLQDSILDAKALAEGKTNIEQTNTFRQEAIRAQTQAQMANPFVSGLKGGIEMAVMAGSMGMSLDAMAAKAALSKGLAQASTTMLTNPAMGIAQAQALTAGIAPSLMSNAAVMAPFVVGAQQFVTQNIESVQRMQAAQSAGLNIFAPK